MNRLYMLGTAFVVAAMTIWMGLTILFVVMLGRTLNDTDID